MSVVILGDLEHNETIDIHVAMQSSHWYAAVQDELTGLATNNT